MLVWLCMLAGIMMLPIPLQALTIAQRKELLQQELNLIEDESILRRSGQASHMSTQQIENLKRLEHEATQIGDHQNLYRIKGLLQRAT
jgi:hypothetical protein